MDNENKQSIPFKSKIAYQYVLIDAIKDCRKKRVDNPSQGFIDAVRALELILLPNERREITDYRLDINDYSKEIEEYIMSLPNNINGETRTDIILDKVKGFSWMTYKMYVDRLYKDNKLVDQNFDGVIDKEDIRILCFEVLLEKIIEILREQDWLIKGNVDDIGGGGHGLDDAPVE